jgi:hypothetical protein
VGFVVDKVAPNTPYSSSIIRGWYNRPNSGRSTKWTQSHPTPRNKKKLVAYFKILSQLWSGEAQITQEKILGTDSVVK